MKTLDSMVHAMVVPAYKALVAGTEKLKEPMEQTFDEKKDEIYEVQRKLITVLGGTNLTMIEQCCAAHILYCEWV